MTETDPLRRLFDEAMHRPAAEREAYVRTHAPDAATAQQVLGLLGVDARAAGFLDEPATETFGALLHAAPERLDEFEIVREIGRGGMGVVYEARDTILGRRVALKVLAGHLIGSEQALERFKDEARSTAQLNHPAIVPVYRFGRSEQGYYIASEFVEGPTLSELIEEERRKRPVDTTREWHSRCTKIATAIADALDVSHRVGIIHRDVKPSNILIDPVRGARLTDFGIAKQSSDEPREQTALMGSCHYVSPEQATVAGQRVDQRSDVFSLGVVMYEMLALRKPFDGADPVQVLRAVIERFPPHVRSIDKRIPRDLDTICHKAIEKRPVDRYQTAAHVAADLRCHAAGDPILAVRPGIGRRSRHWLKRHRKSAVLGLTAMLAVTSGLLAWEIRREWNERLAWFTITSETPDCQVYLQRVNPDSLELDPNAIPIGVTPIQSVKVEPGQYRVTVVAPDADEFVEFNANLFRSGRVELLRMHARQPTASDANNLAKDSVPIGDKLEGGDARSNAGALPARDGTLHGVLRASAACQLNMALISAGEYGFGTEEEDKSPILARRRVSVASFYIDRNEVSNREYRRFVGATDYPPPQHWLDYRYDDSLADRPIVGISLEDAEAYARWKGKRLPTMFEWTAAARGPHDRRYPWGDQLDQMPPTTPTFFNNPMTMRARHDRTHYDLYREHTVAVTQTAPSSATSDLVQIYGNVREFTATIAPPGHSTVLMGRCWTDSPGNNSLADVWTAPLTSRNYKHGFRCARSADAPGPE